MSEQAVNTFLKSERVFPCPECGKGEFSIIPEHYGRAWGPWYCDECGFGFRGRTTPEGHSFVEPWRDRKIKTVVTLRSTVPVTLRVEGMLFVPRDADDDADGRDQYYYDEHTCPTNYLAHVLEVSDDDGQKDPHGIFAWVRTEIEAGT